jgi:hypothetical protein
LIRRNYATPRVARAQSYIYDAYMLIDDHPNFFDSDHGISDGALMLVLGVMILLATFKGGTLPLTPVWLWTSTAGGFAVAAFLIIQGCVLLLSSRWPF